MKKGTTRSTMRSCTRCGWEFSAVTQRLAGSGQWRDVTAPEICHACRDLLSADGKLRAAQAFYRRAMEAYGQRWAAGSQELRRASASEVDEVLSRGGLRGNPLGNTVLHPVADQEPDRHCYHQDHRDQAQMTGQQTRAPQRPHQD